MIAAPPSGSPPPSLRPALNGATTKKTYDGIAWLQRPVHRKPNSWCVAGEHEFTSVRERSAWRISGTTFRCNWTLGSTKPQGRGFEGPRHGTAPVTGYDLD